MSEPLDDPELTAYIRARSERTKKLGNGASQRWLREVASELHRDGGTDWNVDDLGYLLQDAADRIDRGAAAEDVIRRVEWILSVGAITGTTSWRCPCCDAGVAFGGDVDRDHRPPIECHMTGCEIAAFLRGGIR